MAAATGGQTPGPVTHKILGLVVHGMGEQTRGSTLRSVVQNFYPLLRERSNKKEAGIDVRPLDDKKLPQVRLSFVRDNEKYEILVREVHWAEAFVPPSFGGLSAGLIKLLTTWLRRALHELPNIGALRFFYLLLVFLSRVIRNAVIVALMVPGAVLLLPTSLMALFAGRLGWRLPWIFRRLIAFYAKFQPSVVELAILLALPILAVLFVVLVVLDKIGPLRRLLGSWIDEMRTAIVGIATANLGDVWAYAGQPWEASQIRTRFEQRFQDLVECDGKDADAMFVIAYSLGCPVSYEALSGRRMGEFIAREFVEKNRPLYYFTVGSALPAVWRVIPDAERGRLHRRLPKHIQWEDFISAYDPVQTAFIINAVTCLPDKDREWRPVDEFVSKPLLRHNVINQMDIFSEHNAYWNNAEEVLDPILDVITMRRKAGAIPQRRS